MVHRRDELVAKSAGAFQTLSRLLATMSLLLCRPSLTPTTLILVLALRH